MARPWITLLIWATLHRCKDATGDRIAAVGCAQICIVTGQGFTRLATVDRIASLSTVADVAVVAGSVIGRVDTGIIGLVAGISGTDNPVIAVGRCARLAGAGSGITGLRTVAEEFIDAVRVNRALGYDCTFAGPRITLLTRRALHRCIGATGQWIAAVGGAKIAIVAIQICTRHTTGYEITGFAAVADVVVVTARIIGSVHTFIEGGITGVVGTDNPVIAVGRCAGHAGASGVTSLRTVAEQAIIAVRVNRALRRRAVGIIPVVQVIAVVIGTKHAKYSIAARIDAKSCITRCRNILADRGKGGWIVIRVAAATECASGGHSMMLAEARSNLSVVVKVFLSAMAPYTAIEPIAGWPTERWIVES